ncbi:MAG: hypothetical protein J6D21_06785 [Clostridia bacterium]|nr:hypothetical protein [Clostridia bacterium]
MKRILATIVALSMLLSMAVIVPQAVDIEGDWTTYRHPADYQEIDPDTGEEPPYKAAPGYQYTDEGFTTIPADYTGTYPFYKVETKEKFNLKDGVYLQFRVDDFAYQGADGRTDEWMAVTLGTDKNLTPGYTGTASGWAGLIRGAGGGSQAYWGTTAMIGKTENSAGASAELGGMANIIPEVDEEGREIYTFEVKWNGTSYDIILCGVVHPTSRTISSHLESVDKNGDFHIGMIFYSGVKDSKASMTILKFGTSKEDAIAPAGSDTKQPEPNNNIVADMMDPSTIEENKPGVYWDATLYGDNTGSEVQISAQGDNSFHVTVPASESYMHWKVRKDTSYAVEDFPVFAMMVKDYWYDGLLWYNCGDIVNATGGYNMNFSASDGIYYEGEGLDDYALILLDLTDLCSGRINSFMIQFMGVDMEYPEFDICYMGCFRSEEEAKAYGSSYLSAEEKTEESKVEETDEPVVDTDAPQDTDAATTPVEGATDSENQDDSNENGCKSIVTYGMAGIVALAACLFLKKKKES